MMKIFVSGIAGFLGSHLARQLLSEGHQVIGVDNLIGGYRDNIPSGAIFYQEDCCNLLRMKELMVGVDVVYHCACTAYEGLSVFSPHLIARNTYDATVSMMSAAISNKVKRFIYLSSMARYGMNAIPFFEEMTPYPQDPYGISKYAAEFVIRNLAETHGMEYVIAVPHNIIGPGQKYDDPYRNVAAIFINLMLQNRRPIIYGDGSQKRCFSFIDDVVDPLVKMGTCVEANRQVINIGPDVGEVTIRELFNEVAKLTRFAKKPKFLPDRPKEVKFATCSANKARKILGYNPKTELRDGLSRMVDWIKKVGTKNFEYHLPLEIENNLTPRTWKNRLY
jgi:UDP-glucose 4-epimerase